MVPPMIPPMHIDTAAVEAARKALLASMAAVPIYQLSIELQVGSAIELPEYPGSALRGALVQALLDTHCTNKAAPSCAECPLVRACPVSSLVAPMRDDSPRGRDVPRPFTITPPNTLPGRIEAESVLSFGLTLFGSAATLFPYVVLSRARLEANGLGLRNEVGRRGRVVVRRISSLTGTSQVPLYELGRDRISAPVTDHGAATIIARAAALPTDALTLRLRTPLRMKAEGELQRTFRPMVLVHRILERWEAIRREYMQPGLADPLAPLRGEPGNGVSGDPRALLAAADSLRVVRDSTRWIDVASYSSRQHRFTPIGGLVGEVTINGDLGSLREVLTLGEVIQAGKDVVKGNGCFTVAAPETADQRA